MSGSGRKNVFSVRNFGLVFFGALVSELGTLLYSFTVGFYILEISGNNAMLQGLYLALCGVTLLLVTPLGGVLGDRFSKARIMYLCDYLKGGLILLATLLMVLLPGNDARIGILFAIGILGNAVSGIFTPAADSLMPEIVEEESLQQANSYISMKSSLLTVFGVVLAGILYAAVPVMVLFGIIGSCYVLSGVSEMFIRYERVRREEKLTLRVALSDMKDGILYLKGQRAILTIMGAALFINFFFTPVSANFLPYFIKTDLASAPSYLLDRILTPELWSSVFSVLLGISSLVGSLVLSALPQPEKCGRRVALYIGAVAALMVGLTLGYRLLAESGASMNAFLLLLCAGFLVIGLLVVLINIPINTAVMRVVETDKLSKVVSILSILSQGLVPVSSVLAGAVLQYVGCTTLLAVCAGGLLITALALLLNKHTGEI